MLENYRKWEKREQERLPIVAMGEKVIIQPPCKTQGNICRWERQSEVRRGRALKEMMSIRMFKTAVHRGLSL
jgi:hypothetical protein